MRVTICIVAFAALVACKDKDTGSKAEPAPALAEPKPTTGFDAIPVDAQAVVGIDAAKLAESELVRRGVRALLAEDPALDRKIRGLLAACEIDPAADLESILVATGDSPAQAIMVVQGGLDETQLGECVGDAVRAGGGTLEQVTIAGRSAFASHPTRGQTVWFAFAAPRVVVASTDRAWLEAGLGSGPKLSENEELMAVVERADRTGALWAAGRVRPEVGKGLLRVTGGALSGPPRFMFAHLHVSDGVQVELASVMPSASDAAKTAAFARTQLRTYEIIAQGIGLGSLVSRLRVEVRSDTVFLRLILSADELKEVISQIDRALASE